jgi:prepilin-type N-terminal cleavage/methylation domain-containing protein
MPANRSQQKLKNCSGKGFTSTEGFTLMELLITISLIAILTGVLLAVLNPRGIQAKARDSQRVSDLSKVKVALENYFSDNRSYPVSASWLAVNSLSDTSVFTLPLDSKYINTLPEDSKKTGTLCSGTGWRGYGYKSPDGKTYALVTNMEVASMASSACPFGSASTECSGCNVDGTAYFTTAD